MIEAGLIGARFLHYAALVLLFGGWAYAGFGRADVAVGRHFGRLIVASALFAFLGSAAVLAATVAGLGDGLASLADRSLWTDIVTETDFGRYWVVRLGIALLSIALAIAWARSPTPFLSSIGVALAGALLVTVAWTGHAAINEGPAGQVHRLADALHLVAAAVWIGALIPLAWLLASNSASHDAARHLTRFHAIGTAAVLTLIATGLVNSFFLVGHPEALITTRYGQLLLLKLALFVGMLALAARNRLLHTPALVVAAASGSDPSTEAAALRRSIIAELVLGMLVLALVAVLGAIEPAAAA